MVTTLLNLTGIESHNSAPADEKVIKYLVFYRIELSSIVSYRIESSSNTCIGLNHRQIFLGHCQTFQQLELLSQVALDAAKVLSNLLHQSPVVQTYCTTNGFLSKLLSRIKNHSTLGIVEHQIKVAFKSLSTVTEIFESQVFDLRLLFLFTALCPDQRDIAKHNHDGVLALQQSIQVVT